MNASWQFTALKVLKIYHSVLLLILLSTYGITSYSLEKADFPLFHVKEIRSSSDNSWWLTVQTVAMENCVLTQIFARVCISDRTGHWAIQNRYHTITNIVLAEYSMIILWSCSENMKSESFKITITTITLTTILISQWEQHYPFKNIFVYENFKFCSAPR